LEHWPSLQDLHRTRPDAMREFFHEHNCRGEAKIDERIAAIYQAIPAHRTRTGTGSMTPAPGCPGPPGHSEKTHIAKLDRRIRATV